MAKYRPVPRTLLYIVNQFDSTQKLLTGSELLSPEQLLAAGKRDMCSPDKLFEGIPLRPSESPPPVKSPEELFGNQAFAPPGKPLKSLNELLSLVHRPALSKQSSPSAQEKSSSKPPMHDWNLR